MMKVLDLGQIPYREAWAIQEQIHEEVSAGGELVATVRCDGVILSTRHSHFDRAEAVLQACEIEGVEVWMMAEFFNSVNSVREQMRENIRVELETWNEEAKVPVSAIGRAPAREVGR